MASSKMVNDRQRSARTVAQAADTHAGGIADRLESLFGPLAQPDEPVVPWAQVLRQVGRGIDASMAALVTADIAHEAEKADDPAVRDRRDLAFDAVQTDLMDLRGVADSVYGPAGVTALGFAGRTPQEPIALARLGRSVIDNLGALDGLEPVRRGVTFDPSAYAPSLTTAVAELEDALGEVAREAAELDATQVAKDAASAAHDHRFLHGARVLEALFSLAGDDELAARVRPSRRRPGRTADDAGEPDDLPGLTDT